MRKALLAAALLLAAAPATAEPQYSVNFGCFRLSLVETISQALEKSSAAAGAAMWEALRSGCGLTGDGPARIIEEIRTLTDYEGEDAVIAKVEGLVDRDLMSFYTIVWKSREIPLAAATQLRR